MKGALSRAPFFIDSFAERSGEFAVQSDGAPGHEEGLFRRISFGDGCLGRMSAKRWVNDFTYAVVQRCIQAAGIDRTVTSCGTLFTGDETIDEAIALNERSYTLSASQRASVRHCAQTYCAS